MNLQKITSKVTSIIGESGAFIGYEIKNYNFNQSPANADDYRYCVVELFRPAATILSKNKIIFVLIDVENNSVVGAPYQREYNNDKNAYKQNVKMHLFETAKKIIVAEMGHKVSYIDIRDNKISDLTDFAGTGSISGAFMNSYKKLTFRENTWGEIVKSNLPEYIGMISDDDSFLIINIKTWTIVEMIKDILPMLEVEQFSVLQKNDESKELFVVLGIRSEFYDYSRERIGVWKIKLSKKGRNYGIPRGTYAVDGYKNFKTFFNGDFYVVEVDSVEGTNKLLF